MKAINGRELQNVIPHMPETLTQEHLLPVSNEEAVAPVLPVNRQRDVPSLADHRAGMTLLRPGVLGGLVRDERDRASIVPT